LVISGESHQIPSLLTQAQMLVLCSECEGFPNVILEAMAARLPVVTTPIGDAGLVVQEGKTGCVVPAENPKGIAECILRLAQFPELRRQFGEAGRQRVEREYRCELLPSRLLSLCHQFAIQERNLPLRRQILQHQPKDRPVECLVAVPHGPE
ncbi:MAG TPA: glycosyltransferase, partial [Bryobacteraceae bacterium]|nr:glycosyltransferase [Bryobacteraceae bacterium]